MKQDCVASERKFVVKTVVVMEMDIMGESSLVFLFLGPYSWSTVDLVSDPNHGYVCRKVRNRTSLHA